MQIEVLNWDKFQPRKDLKSLKWFRLEADLIFSQSLFGLTPAEKWFFIFILSSCAKHNSNILKLDVCYAHHNSGLSEKDILNAIENLQKNQLINYTPVNIRTNPYRSVQIRTDSCPTIHNKTIHNNTEQNITIHNNTEQVKKVVGCKALLTQGTEVWNAYAYAYATKYRTQPIRNAKTNSICKRLVETVGKEKAINIAKHYLTINDQWYLKNYHKLDFCLSDYQKIITSFDTGLKITSTQANDLDRKQTISDAFDRVSTEYEEIYDSGNPNIKSNGRDV